MAIQNLALNKTATASSYVMPYSPSRAVNGSITPTSRWLCNTVPASLVVDLLGQNVITSWVVKNMSVAGWRSPDYNMVEYKLQGSNDNNTWYDIDSVTNNSNNITTRNISTLVVFRYVRLYVTNGLRTNSKFASIMEFEVYGCPSQYLSALVLKNGQSSLTLNPSFTPNGFTYTTPSVPYNTSSINVIPTPQDARATVKVNNVAVTNYIIGVPVGLNVGLNNISVVVTSGDGQTTQAYTVTVEREQGAILTGLTISSGELNPTFSSNTLGYTAPNVGYDTTSVTVTPTTTVAGTTITVAGNPATSGQPSAVNLNVGSNTINIVTTNGTASQTYTITVVRASSPYLTQFDVTYKSGKSSYETKTVTTSSNQTEYNVDILNTATSVTIKPTTQDVNAVILVNGQNIPSGQISASITVVVGTTRIPINVTSAIGTDSKTYGITII